MRLQKVALYVCLAGCTALALPAAADDLVGVRAGVYTDAEEAFVGAELLLPIARRVEFNPNIEYVFLDGATYMTFNADFHYDLPSRSRAFVWVGGGLGVSYLNPEGPGDSNTDVGANFLAGVGFKGEVIPYFQANLIASDTTEFVVAFGLRF